MLNRSMRSRRTSQQIVGALGVAAVLSTAACSGGTDSDSGSGGNGGTGATDATISVAVQAAPRSLDPAQLDEGQQGYVWNQGVYDTLLFLDNDMQIQPNAAESYQYSEDLKTLTLTLHEGMTFSSGNLVDAEAVRATLERSRTTPGPVQAKLSSITSIEARDARTVVITLSAPDSALLVNLSGSGGVIADPAAFADPNLALDPVGSGPYTLSDETVPGSTYVLERREDYWDVDQYPFEKVTVRVIQDPTATLNALQAGELNAATVQPNDRQRLEAAGFEISDPIATAVGSILLLDREGTVVPALADVRVRQAINMAFDREGFVQAVTQGAGEPTNQFVNPAGDLYVEDLAEEYPYDPEAARELMADAGYADGFSLTMPSTAITQRVEPLITQALSDIGIDVTWAPQPPTNSSASMRSRQFGAAFWFQGLNVTELEAADRFGSDAFFNPFNVASPETDELIAQAAAETDADARHDLYQQVGEITVEEAWYAPVMNTSVFYATKNGIEYLSKGAPLPSVRRFGVTQ
jgi:peptide/nickel transport system substrate-binding protein